MQQNTAPIAIIGAGITGLTTAFHLQQKGLPATVYEASNRVGGVIRTETQNGFLAECGPNSILETSPKLQELIQDLGLENERLNANSAAKTRYIVRRQKPIALPSSPPTFFSSPAFSPRAKLRLLAEPFITSKSNETESLANFVLRRLGREFLDYAISPFVSGVYAGDPTQLSTALAFPKLYALEQKYGSLIKGALLGMKERKKRGEVSKKDARMFTFAAGMEALPQRLQEKLGEQILLNSPIQTLQQTENNGWLVNGRPHRAVILALPAHQMIALETPFDLSSFSNIYYPPVVSLSLGFRRDQFQHPLDGFGMLIPRVENSYSLGTLFTSSIFANRAPAEHVMLTTFVGGSVFPERGQQEDHEIIRSVLQDHFALLGLRGAPCFTRLNAYPHAIPQYTLGYQQHLNRMTALEKEHPGLYFAGHYRDGISVSDSILSGLKTADKLQAG